MAALIDKSAEFEAEAGRDRSEGGGAQRGRIDRHDRVHERDLPAQRAILLVKQGPPVFAPRVRDREIEVDQAAPLDRGLVRAGLTNNGDSVGFL